MHSAPRTRPSEHTESKSVEPIPSRLRSGNTPSDRISHSLRRSRANTNPAGISSNQAIRPKNPVKFNTSAIADEFHGSSGKQAQCNIDSGPAKTLGSG